MGVWYRYRRGDASAEGRRALTDFTAQWRLFRDAVDDLLGKGTT